MRERKHFRMRSDTGGARNCGYAPMDDLGCAVNHVLSCHGSRFLLIFFRSLLGYLKYCNVAAHSVDSDIFYVVINLSAGFKSYIITFIS